MRGERDREREREREREGGEGSLVMCMVNAASIMEREKGGKDH